MKVKYKKWWWMLIPRKRRELKLMQAIVDHMAPEIERKASEAVMHELIYGVSPFQEKAEREEREYRSQI